MRSPNDPIWTAWAGTLAIGVLGLAVCAWAIVWACSPVENRTIELDWKPQPVATEPDRAPTNESGQLAAFDVRLWTAPERPVEAALIAEAAKPASPPPPRLILLGIVSSSDPQSSEFEAILYDPDTDTTHIVRAGAMIGSVTLGAIARDWALLISQSGEIRLTLDTGEKQAARG